MWHASSILLGSAMLRVCVCDRAVFTWVSKLTCVYFGFELLRSVIGLKNSRHFLNQSEVNQNQSQVKSKPIVTCSHNISRASCNCFEFDWTLDFSASLVIGQGNYFGFGFTAFNWKLLKKINDTKLPTPLPTNFVHSKKLETSPFSQMVKATRSTFHQANFIRDQ